MAHMLGVRCLRTDFTKASETVDYVILSYKLDKSHHSTCLCY